MKPRFIGPIIFAVVLCGTSAALLTARVEPSPTPTFGKSEPTVKWRFKTDGPVLSSPQVLDGTAYFGSSDSFLYAIDLSTGKQKWKFETNTPITGSPVVSNGVVFFVGWDGFLYAVDAKTGLAKWKFKMEYERKFQAKHLHGQDPAEQTIPDPWDFFTSTPAVANGKVYFGSGDGHVYAVSEEDGKLAWKFKTGDVVHASATLANGLVYIGSWDSRFYALDMETGEQKWMFQAGIDNDRHNQQGFQGAATVVGNTLYVGCRDNHTYALNAQTGEKLWAYSEGTGWVSNRPFVTGDIVWVGSNPFRGLDAKTGALRFNTTKAGVFNSPVGHDGIAFFGMLTGSLYAFDPKSGEIKWEFQTDARKADVLKMLDPDGKYNSAAVGPVFGDFEDDYLMMYRRFSLGSIISTPAMEKGVLYFGSADGNLYAVQEPS